MNIHNIKTITGSVIYLLFTTTKSQYRSLLAVSFVKNNVKVIETSELYRLATILKEEERSLPNSVDVQTSLNYTNAVRWLKNEAVRRRKRI